MKPRGSIEALLVRRQRLCDREEASDIAREEIAPVAFQPPGGFAHLFELGALAPSSYRRGPFVRRHEIDLGQETAVVLERDACHRPVTFAGDHDEAAAGTEPDLECIAMPVCRRGDLLYAVPAEERERLPHGRGKFFERRRRAYHGLPRDRTA